MNNCRVASCIRAWGRGTCGDRRPAHRQPYCHAGHPAAAAVAGGYAPAGVKSSRENASYELPWFMVVGSPGDGKTTALLNTGLQRSRWRSKWSRPAYPDSTGWRSTPHCDWWFNFNEAVLIDTAGRYARPPRRRRDMSRAA